jgi:anion-transporting  ArsA/GET3 family ATPase
MNAAFALLAALAVAVGGYRWYAGYVDRKILQVDSRRVTLAKIGFLLRYPARSPAHRGDHPVSQVVPGFRHPCGGILVNGLLPYDPAHEPGFIANRRAMHAEHLETIWRLFDGQVRALVPLFETEVRGNNALNRLAAALFGSGAGGGICPGRPLTDSHGI